jgi:hypothetical protein
MSEHKLLKQICDTIWYEINLWDYYWYDDSYKSLRSAYTDAEVNVREIIFTTEFQYKFKEYIINWLNSKKEANYFLDNYSHLLLDNIDNPIQYLADLLWITN